MIRGCGALLHLGRRTSVISHIPRPRAQVTGACSDVCDTCVMASDEENYAFIVGGVLAFLLAAYCCLAPRDKVEEEEKESGAEKGGAKA